MIGQINAVVFSFALWTYGWARGRWILHEANHTREQTAGGAGGAGGRPGRHGRLGGTARTTTGDSRRGAATAATVLHGAAGGGCWRIKRTESCGQTTTRGTPTRKGRRHPPLKAAPARILQHTATSREGRGGPGCPFGANTAAGQRTPTDAALLAYWTWTLAAIVGSRKMRTPRWYSSSSSAFSQTMAVASQVIRPQMRPLSG
jgi:hypothetical protein